MQIPLIFQEEVEDWGGGLVFNLISLFKYTCKFKGRAGIILLGTEIHVVS